MNLKKMIRIATEMKQNNSFLLDVSELTGDEAAIITELVKNPCVLKFFIKVKNIPIKKLVVICNYLKSKEELENMY